MADTPRPDTKPDATADAKRLQATSNPPLPSRFKVMDVRESDVVLDLGDGRGFLASLGDGVMIDDDNAKRGRFATITHDGLDSSEAPKDAKVTKFLPRD